MRILHRINLDIAAGVENQFRSFVCHPAVRASMTHDLVYGSGFAPELRSAILPQMQWAGSLKRIGRMPVPRAPRQLREWRLASLLSSRRPDALLAWSGFGREVVSKAAQHSGVPLIYREGGGAWYAHSAPAVRHFAAAMRGAICNTYASMRMLQLKWGFDGPARVCLGGIRPDMLAAADARTPREPGARIQLGTAARLAAEKGVCLAIHALRELGDRGLDCELHIAGDGPDRAALQRLAEKLDVGAQVHFLGSVQDMAGFYASIDALLHPALQEPLGNVTIEASAFGVPVVATRVDGMAETIRHGETGMTVSATEPFAEYRRFGGSRSGMLSEQVYDPDEDALRAVRFATPEALAEAVAHVVADRERHDRMSEAAAAYVRRLFLFDRHVEDVLCALHAFLGNQPSGPPGPAHVTESSEGAP